MFADALRVTVPLPTPDAPFVTVSQLVSLVAVHEHHPPAVTATLAVSPPYGTPLNATIPWSL